MANFFQNLIYEDKKTRVIIPNTRALVGSLTSTFASFFDQTRQTNPAFFFNHANRFSSNYLTGGVTGLVNFAADALSIGFGVTKVMTKRSNVIPRSKGIGSTNEILHLLGSKNEEITVEFTTDNFPGILGYLFRQILNATLEEVDIIYLVGDMYVATPCIMESFQIYKDGVMKGAIMGSMSLIVLPTDNNPFTVDNFNDLTEFIVSNGKTLGSQVLAKATSSLSWAGNLLGSIISR
jgi:hypothetical protein